MRRYFWFLLLLLGQNMALAQTANWQGQLSGWLTSNPEKSFISQAGVRYIPDILVEKTLAENFFADAVFSLNTFAAGSFHGWENADLEGKIKLYRAWARFSSNRFEARLGLQKINFGSATLFRPLRWFDRIDPRDPLELTDGVYALLLRYYFLNNANLWLWGLYGNDETKGQEFAPTKSSTVEFGGRAQVPLFTGEVGLSYHHRQADFSQVSLPLPAPASETSVPENRLGLDGKWDVGIGVWFEGTLVHHKTEVAQLRYQRAWTVGVDYTFGVGNGLTMMFEQYVSKLAETAFGSGEGSSFSGLSVNYPLGLVDNISGIINYDWDNQDWYRTITFQRLYDNWSFYIIGFWNPDELLLTPNQVEDNPFAGKGLQFMLVFNH